MGDVLDTGSALAITYADTEVATYVYRPDAPATEVPTACTRSGP